MAERRTPIWLWPNLLGLDAPFIAVVWLMMFAGVWKVGFLQWQAYVGLALGVWVIYLVDRLLDVNLLHREDPRLCRRHEFVRDHRKWLGMLGLAAAAACTFIAFFALPSRLIVAPGAPFGMGYLTPAVVMVVVYFSLSIASSGDPEIPHLRNLLAGLTFSYGTAMLVHVNIGTESPWHLLASREMLCFGLLCAANISAIHFWERSRTSRDENFRAAHELALTLPLAVLGVICVISAQADHETTRRPFFYAVLVAAALLFVLNRIRERFSMDALRVLADGALVAPLPVFWLLSLPS